MPDTAVSAVALEVAPALPLAIIGGSAVAATIRMMSGQGLPACRVSVMVAPVTVLSPLAAAGSGTSTEL